MFESCRPSSLNVLDDDGYGRFGECGTCDLAALGTDEGSIAEDVVSGVTDGIPSCGCGCDFVHRAYVCVCVCV